MKSFFESDKTAREWLTEGIENKLIGMTIFKPESKEKGLVISVGKGWLADTFQVTFKDGTSAQYRNIDINNILMGNQNMYMESLDEEELD